MPNGNGPSLGDIAFNEQLKMERKIEALETQVQALKEAQKLMLEGAKLQREAVLLLTEKLKALGL